MREELVKCLNINISGKGAQTMMFAHGLGCDQQMWRYITPAFNNDYKIITFDYIGCGKSDLSYYNRQKYSSLQGYIQDVLDIAESLELENIVFVGHSVSCMIGAMAAIAKPALFKSIIMVSPSPRYINDANYYGGFDKKEIEELLELMEKNFTSWAGAFVPVIMKNSERPELSAELEEKLCSTDPAITCQFARATFLADHRTDLPNLKNPVLILQSTDNVIAPLPVGEYLQKTVPDNTFYVLKATGNCPHLSAPEETIEVMKKFLENSSR
jgi:sigma-B regulation protein RsbQ